MSSHSRRGIGRAVLVLSLVTTPAAAQELNPRAYWPAPRGTNLITIGAVHNTGNIVTVASLPLGDVDNETNTLQLTYYRTFSLAGRTANFTVQLPASVAQLDARLEEAALDRDLSGLGDMTLRVSVNLVGAPSMTGPEFQAFRELPRNLFGASLRFTAPTGSYNEDKAINLSANRWTVKPEIGYLVPAGRWVLEFLSGVSIFGDNDEFVGGTLKQDPIWAIEFHLVRRIKTGLWTSVDLTYYAGGTSTVYDVLGDTPIELDNRQDNSRIGLTFVRPFGKRHALRIAASTGLSVESGSDLDSVVLAYSYLWN